MAKDDFQTVLKGKKLPILTLDNKWYRLFEKNMTPEMKRLEGRINDLLKEQGRVTNEVKDLKKIKNNLMAEIVANMPEDGRQPDPSHQKKIAESKRLIDQVNERIAKYDDDMLDLPRMIDEENFKLMLLSMEICYDEFLSNTEDIEDISAWIKSMRMELKRNIIKKQQMEVKNVELYTYMNDIFGSDVINLFDIKYDVEAKKKQLMEAAEAKAEKKRAEEAKERAEQRMLSGGGDK
ncbi:MAG TPA: hypothetical protein DIS68_06660 [Lachnospiraceae bacterium]|nr:hypothetical protein [Lachnospiraceae bacterium]MBQ4242284.1 hypothetical protein [Lachnospiraceae bacterium]MBQ9566473.1 hypothetical protein [Lachnospiraceae bacterium]HAL31656.1 hypothetical protein [Lachnospiraceae bacterium]HBB59137.1 hypothetical protein [Lachnospiraceae bacterium]